MFNLLKIFKKSPEVNEQKELAKEVLKGQVSGISEASLSKQSGP